MAPGTSPRRLRGSASHLPPPPDLCHPEGCAAAAPSPDPLDVDLALVVDNAAPGMPAERLEAIGELFHRLLGHLQLAGPDPAQRGTRIALVLSGPSAPGQGLAEVPFGLPGSGEQLWERLRLALVPRAAAASTGGTVAWALRHAFPQRSGSRIRVLFAVGTGATVLWDKEARQALAPLAPCKDLGVLVLSLGRAGTERPEAAVPEALPAWRYHSLRLGSVHPPEMGYAERTVLGFLRRLRGERRRGGFGRGGGAGASPGPTLVPGGAASVPKASTSITAPLSLLLRSGEQPAPQHPGVPLGAAPHRRRDQRAPPGDPCAVSERHRGRPLRAHPSVPCKTSWGG